MFPVLPAFYAIVVTSSCLEARAWLRQLVSCPNCQEYEFLIVIAEGTDYGSTLGFKELRELVEPRYVTCFVALVDDHPTRGTKSLLRYGWSLQDLAHDTAGTFVENSKNAGRTATRLGGMVASLRLVTFEITGPPPGRHRVSVSSTSGLRLHTQKAIFSETVGLPHPSTSGTEGRLYIG